MNEAKSSSPSLSERLSDRHIRIAIGIGAALVALLMMKLRFCGALSLPANPPAPIVVEIADDEVKAAIDSSEGVYTELLSEDSVRYRIRGGTSLTAMSKAFPYEISKKRFTLTPRTDLSRKEVGPLRLSVSARDRMLVLRVDNLTDSPVAFRVATRPELGRNRCKAKAVWTHNALAVREQSNELSFIERTECIHKRNKGVTILSVETMSLPVLSYYYISSMQPTSLGQTSAATDGHRPPPPAKRCQRVLSSSLEASLESGETTWRDMVDFYARHSCHQYRFPEGYKAFEQDGERALPATR